VLNFRITIFYDKIKNAKEEQLFDFLMNFRKKTNNSSELLHFSYQNENKVRVSLQNRDFEILLT
jgi:hypothetical protein